MIFLTGFKGSVFRSFQVFLAMLLLLPAVAWAKIIVLKDGTRVEAENVREENGLVRFSLPGYEGIFITYSREIIEGIYTEDEVPPVPTAAKSAADPLPSPGETDPYRKSVGERPTKTSPPPDAPREPTKPAAPEASRPPSPSERAADADPGQVVSEEPYAEYRNIEFYNPRRRYKYWTGPEEKHLRFEEAVEVLADRFGRSPEWVIENLGESNNLAQIHRNLSERLKQKKPTPEPTLEAAVSVQFYDPRRRFKYWSGPERRHDTLEEAVEALAMQYDRSPEWIKAHLGSSNDLAEIHHRLSEAAARE